MLIEAARTPRGEYLASVREDRGFYPIKILVYGLNYAPELTGIGKYTSELCAWLAGRGHMVKIVTGHPYYPNWKVADGYDAGTYQSETRDGVEVTRCPLFIPEVPTGKKRILSHLSFSLSSTPKVIQLTRRFKPDLIFCVVPSFFVTPAAIFAAKLGRIPAWLHVQDFEIDSAFELGMLKGGILRQAASVVESSILKQFDTVSAISTKMVDRLVAKAVDRSNAVEFRNWVDTKVVRPLDRMTSYRRQLGLSSEHVVALYSGSIAAKQGIESLATAVRLVSTENPKVAFIFCGNGAMQGQLAQAAAGLTNAKFLDLQPEQDMPQLLATADIHLVPQRAQVADLMLPSKIAPILSSGRPSVVMADKGTQLAAEIRGAGLAVPPGDDKALAAAILKLASEPELRNSMGQIGRIAACERWEKEAILLEFENRLLGVTMSRASK
jgi:colanic acid biosynthesis glycosyl transferase WcaI